jgi:Domain of unknown function (DUF4287)
MWREIPDTPEGLALPGRSDPWRWSRPASWALVLKRQSAGSPDPPMMPDHPPIYERITMPTNPAPAERPSGPASYFASIEKKYGRPIDEWLALARERSADSHMTVVRWLKEEHGLGHGHANAIVAYVRAEHA